MTLDPAAPRESASRRGLVGQGLLIAALLGTALVGISPAPYVVERPGPVYDTLGDTEVDGETVPVIQVDGAPSYPSEGRLDLLTVYLDGSREHPLDWFEVVTAWLDPSRALLPVDAVFPGGQTEEQSDEESARDMDASQRAAVAAALTELGVAFTSTVTVDEVPPDGPADGVLEVGDELLSVDGTPVASDGELRAAIADAGVGATVELGIRRDGVESTVSLTTVARSESDASPVIGVVPGVSYAFPFEVTINLQNVGGPSAGMMFALGIYDTLTPGSLTGGQHVAGTGTIDGTGAVGPIGGIRQKMIGARSAGAEWFLAPQANCGEVVGHIPAGLEVFAVSELAQAVDVVTAIGEGSSTDSFARCG
ncbi:MAG: PDZ domain-containing protein [Micrococcales bacterium]|nr:PDZ domain-containing protein [Micrococcales bacterium]OJX69439.1 MAG: hypothetical protein BGO94_13060 [Micrococcales bacterium 72-143]